MPSKVVLCTGPCGYFFELKISSATIDIFYIPRLFYQLDYANLRVFFRLCIRVIRSDGSCKLKAILCAKFLPHIIGILLNDLHELVVVIFDQVYELVCSVGK